MSTESFATMPREPAAAGQLIAGITLSYLLAAGLMYVLVMAGGIWNQLANTRLLSPLIEGGVVRYHDKQIGVIPGVPELKYYVMSQDPVAWMLVVFAFVLMLGFWAVKSIQFHAIARNLGAATTLGADTRAYLFGQGVARWMPFNLGEVGTLLARSGQAGGDEERAIGTIYLARCFVVFEIAFFGLIGLFFLGWGEWLGLLLWPLFIMVIGYYLLRVPGSWRAGLNHAAGWRMAFDWLAARPLASLLLALLSIVAFLLEHVAIYAVSQAFSSANVLLNIDFSVFMMALVAGMIARLVPVTPGGIGQFEWGFAMVIYLSGTGMPEAVTMALLFLVLRYGVGIAISLGFRFFSDVPVTIRDIFGAARVSD